LEVFVLSRLRSKLTYANVVATVALFMVVTGIGFAVAAIPKKSVGKKQLKNGAVSGKKIRKNAVTAPKIKSGAVGRSEIASGAVNTGKISNKSVTRSKLGDDVTPLVGPLRTGQTLRGMFDVGDQAAAAGNTTVDGTTFQFPLNNAPTAPTANVIDQVATPGATTTNCPGISGGNTQTPNAAAGQLCIYITGKTNLAAVNPLTLVNTSRLGFGLTAASAAGGAYEATGFWAVTAP
jgi:hypothetical protein